MGTEDGEEVAGGEEVEGLEVGGWGGGGLRDVSGWEGCFDVLTLRTRGTLRKGTQKSLILEVDLADFSISCHKNLRNSRTVCKSKMWK